MGSEMNRARSRKSPSLLGALALVLILAAAAAGSGLRCYLRADYRDVFLRQRADLAQVREERLEPDPFFENSRVVLRDAGNRELHCLVRAPRNPEERKPALLVIDGYEWGKKVVSLFESTTYAVLISFDWPDDDGHRYQGMNIGPFLAGIRGSLIRMVSMVPVVVDYLAQRPDVDPEKILIVGASLGVPIAVAGTAIDPRVRAAVLLYGGGDIAGLAEHSARPAVPQAWKRRVAGWWVGAALAPIEPLKYVQHIAPRPVLMINGNSDESIPRECVLALYGKAGEPRELIWLETGHVAPEMRELVGRLEQIVGQWTEEHHLR